MYTHSDCYKLKAFVQSGLRSVNWWKLESSPGAIANSYVLDLESTHILHSSSDAAIYGTNAGSVFHG